MAKRANDLDRKTWLKYSMSVWSDIKRTAEERRLDHPAPFPEQLVRRLIECYTTSEDMVILDPFAGTGTTLVAAKRMGKQGIGFEIYDDFADIARVRCAQGSFWDGPDARLFRADARRMAEFLEEESVDLVITSPPYWDVLNRPRSKLWTQRRDDYGDSTADLGNIPDYGQFLEALEAIFREVHRVLKAEKFCIVIVMDISRDRTFYPFHVDVIRMMQDAGFNLEDIFIWDRRSEYHDLVPFGYPACFRAFKAHEYILVFRKEVSA